MSTETQIKLRLNDVYSFRWSPEYYKNNSYPDHCFDGQFIIKQREDGELYFMDTYWASKHDGFKHWSSSRSYTLEQALKNGSVTYVCNLDDVEEIQKHDLIYYADEDLFDLSYQHGCYGYYVKKKGAVRSPEKMRAVILNRIGENEHKISSAQREINGLRESLEKLLNGDLTIYI